MSERSYHGATSRSYNTNFLSPVYYYKQVAQMNVTFDDCPRSCQVITYKLLVTSAAFPSQATAKYDGDNQNGTFYDMR